MTVLSYIVHTMCCAYMYLPLHPSFIIYTRTCDNVISFVIASEGVYLLHYFKIMVYIYITINLYHHINVKSYYYNNYCTYSTAPPKYTKWKLILSLQLF